MSGFAKPSTPIKSRSNVRQPTPTKSKLTANSGCSSSSENLNSSAKILDDINLLLHLETVKRNRENEIILRQKIEEAYKLFEERRHKYHSLVAKYAALVKLASVRKVLMSKDHVDYHTDSVFADAISIAEKLNSGTSTDYISIKELNKFKNMLNHMEKYTNLPLKRAELVDIQSATNAIKYSIKSIEISLDKCTTHGLDHFTDSLDMVNYPTLFGNYENNE